MASASSSNSEARISSSPPAGRVGSDNAVACAVRNASWISSSSWKRRALSAKIRYVRMRVEVPHAVPLCVLEQLHHVERVADALGAEPEVLVVLADPLRVEVDVEELPVPQRLRGRVREG